MRKQVPHLEENQADEKVYDPYLEHERATR